MIDPRSAWVRVSLACTALCATGTHAWAAQTFAYGVAPGKFDEHCLKIEAGQSIRWRFAGSGKVDFNIHHHRGKDVFYPVRRDRVERASGSFRAHDSDDYCLMWTNRGAAAVRISGAIERLP